MFHQQRVVEFQHCDPAGIVFYPRYFEMISSVVERFFTDALNTPFSDLHLRRNMGMPMGRIEARFHAPSRLGDTLDFTLAVERIGTASADFTLRCSGRGEPRFTAAGTLVHFDFAAGKSAPWSDDLREGLNSFLIMEDQT